MRPSYLSINYTLPNPGGPKLPNLCCASAPAAIHTHAACVLLPVVVLQAYDAGLPDNMNQKVFIHTFNGTIWERDYNKSSLTAIGTPFMVRAQRALWAQCRQGGRPCAQQFASISLPCIVEE